MRPPSGLLIDFGGTLVEEVAVDVRAGTALMLERAEYRRPELSVEEVFARAERVSAEISGRRDHTAHLWDDSIGKAN